MNMTSDRRASVLESSDRFPTVPPPGARRRATPFKKYPSVKYLEYRRGRYRYYGLFYKVKGKRHRETRNTYAAAEQRAQEIHVAYENGQITMAAFTEADRGAYLRSLEIIQATGKQLELACSIYADSDQTLRRAGIKESVAEICRKYVQEHPAGIIEKPLADVVSEFLQRRLGGKTKRNQTLYLERFAKKFSGPISALAGRGPEIQDWLYSLKDMGERTRKNHFDAVRALLNFAARRRYLQTPGAIVDAIQPPVPEPETNDLYTPDELVQLLNKAETTEAGRKLVPLICITAFAGVRHGEMSEEAKLDALDWSNIDWARKKIKIPDLVAKGGRIRKNIGRLAHMPDNLAAWLLPYRRAHGKICDLKCTADALCRLVKSAGIAGRKRNALRNSFITYSSALAQDLAKVATAAGNSAAMIKKHYLEVDTAIEEAAIRWFQIQPTRADVLPLFNWGARENCQQNDSKPEALV